MRQSKLSIQSIEFDVDNYQFLTYDLPKPPMGDWMFDGRRRAAEWRPAASVYSLYTRKPRPDIWHLAGAAALIFSPGIVPNLEPYVSDAGELLAVNSTSEQFVILNVTRVVAALDARNSSFDVFPWELAFQPKSLSNWSGLFKIPETCTSQVLHLERTTEPDSFRSRVENLGLKGITFRTVWRC